MSLVRVAKLESKMDSMIQYINTKEPQKLTYEVTSIGTNGYVLSGKDTLGRIVYTKLLDTIDDAFQFIAGMYHIMEEI